MPIRTNRNGVLGQAIVAFAVIAVVISQPISADAAPSSTTKGVRTTAYKPVATVKKKPAYPKISLPPTKDGDTTSMDVVNRALSFVGSRYKWGGSSPLTGFDCSGLVHYLFRGMRSNLPRTASAMYRALPKVSELRPGDIIFFGRGRVIHTALYIGKGRVVHASTPKRGVKIDPINSLVRALGLVGVSRIS